MNYSDPKLFSIFIQKTMSIFNTITNTYEAEFMTAKNVLKRIKKLNKWKMNVYKESREFEKKQKSTC